MQQNRKFIVGSGITGLIWKYYHPEFQIISPDGPGGIYSKTHMVWLHDTVETRKLVEDLGFEVKLKQSPIGYYYDGFINDSISPEMSLKLIQKKMTDWSKPLDKDFVPTSSDLSLSTGNTDQTNYMNCLDVDLEEIVKRLQEKNDDSVQSYVTNITDETITVKKDFKEAGIVLEYDELISTMAAPFFWKAYKGGEYQKEFKSLPITNVIVKDRPLFFDEKYEMVYYDDSVPYSRVSHLGGKYALEFTGEMTREQFSEMYPNLVIEEFFVLKQGRIFKNDDNIPPNEKITFSGRFSKWEYGITTEHVALQVINHKSNEKNN